MITRAPGKLVLSGAYVVLEGAPALVAAVDRYVVADPGRPAELLTEEVRTAIALGVIDEAPWFDASALRADEGRRKLGVGSSAAILVASMAARAAWQRQARGEGPPGWDREALLAGALDAHRAAQGGGSGLDVAASVLGGVLRCRLQLRTGAPLGYGPQLETIPHALPDGLTVTVLASEAEARTSAMLARVREFAERSPARYRTRMEYAAAGAGLAASAESVADFVVGLQRQVEALGEIGELAGVPIVTEALRQLGPAAAEEGAVIAPSGAGGGDVAILVGSRPPSEALLQRAFAAGLSVEPMRIAARGVHLAGNVG